MRIKYEFPCIVASMLIMLGTSAYTKTNEKKPHNYVQNRTHVISSVLHTHSVNTIQEAIKIDNGVRYILSNGDKIERIGGSIAWRNNNPGCIRYSQNAVNMGAIGKANGFAIFPDEKTGMDAIRQLLLSDSYRNSSIAGAIYRYAPPHENNTEHYINSLCKTTRISRETKLGDLNPEQFAHLVKTIRKIEGWHVGTEIHKLAPKPDYFLFHVNFARDNTRRAMMHYKNEKTM